MAAKITILRVRTFPKDFEIEAALWLPVPTGRESRYADSKKNSNFLNISAQDLADLRAGKFFEEVKKFLVPKSWSPAQIKAELESRYSDAAAAFPPSPDEFRFYGASWNGATWTGA